MPVARDCSGVGQDADESRIEGGHETTNHGKHGYVRAIDPSVHSNTIEGAFSLLKRGVHGTFHSVSRERLPKFPGEFESRLSTRFDNDAERVEEAIRRERLADLLHERGGLADKNLNQVNRPAEALAVQGVFQASCHLDRRR